MVHLKAYTWDWVMSIPEEYTFIRKVGFKPPNIVYFTSRLATLGSCVATVIFRITPLPNCAVLKWVEGVFFEIAVPATSLLFFFRVKAVYNNSHTVIAFFGLLWLSIAGLSILIMLGITGNRIPYTRRCTEGLAHTYTTVPIIMTAINDTLIFLAITYRLLSSSMVDTTWRAQTKSFFTGSGLHKLSKALLQSGQAYYFATIGVSIISISLIFNPSIPGPLHAILGTATFALANAMACRVYRAIILGIIKDPQESTTKLSSIVCAANNIQLDGDDDSTTTSRRNKPFLSTHVGLDVTVEMDTRRESSDGDTFGGRGIVRDSVMPYDASRRV